MMDMQQAAEEHKMQITEVVEQVKTKIDYFEKEMLQEMTLLNKTREDTEAARNKVRKTIETLIQILKKHEMAMLAKLDEVDEERQRCHTVKQELVQLLVTQLKSSAEYSEAVLQRDLSFEILQQQAVVKRCKTLLNEKAEVNIKKPSNVDYVTNEKVVEDVRSAFLGQVLVSYSNSSRSLAEGKGLEEAEVGRESNFTITTKDSEGKQCYYENDQLAITIKTSSGEDLVDKVIKDNKDGEYKVAYTPHCADEHTTVLIQLNGKPLTASPWCVQVSPYQYKSAHRFGSFGHGVQGIAFSEVSDTIAVADSSNCRVQLFNSNGKLIEEFAFDRVFDQHENRPTSVAFTRSGNVIVVHGCRISLFTEKLQFIEFISSEHVKGPCNLSVARDGRMVVIDSFNKAITVLSPDGEKVLLSFNAPDCDESPISAICHQNMFFVSYGRAHCIKVFSKEGVFLYDIGRKGTGDGQLRCPTRLAIDKFNNIIVCDKNNSRLQFFTLNGKFVNSTLTRQFNRPCAIATSKSGYVIVTYNIRNAHVNVFQ